MRGTPQKGALASERVVVVYIGAPNDTNGNPRRGWIVGYGTYNAQFVDEGYIGRQALRAVGVDPSAGDVQLIAVTPSEYRKWKKRGTDA